MSGQTILVTNGFFLVTCDGYRSAFQIWFKIMDASDRGQIAEGYHVLLLPQPYDISDMRSTIWNRFHSQNLEIFHCPLQFFHPLPNKCMLVNKNSILAHFSWEMVLQAPSWVNFVDLAYPQLWPLLAELSWYRCLLTAQYQLEDSLLHGQVGY